MSYRNYVDDLAKRGIIDGNIAAILIGKHEDEVKDPLAVVREKLQPILDDMWSDRHDGNPSGYADKVDDALTSLENGGSESGRAKVEIICTYQGRRYRLTPDGRGDCSQCAFYRKGEELPCDYIHPSFNDYLLCCDLEGVWKLADNQGEGGAK